MKHYAYCCSSCDGRSQSWPPQVSRRSARSLGSVVAEVVEDDLGVVVAKGDAVRKGHAGAVVAADPESVQLLLRRLEAFHHVRVTELVLRYGRGPDSHSDEFGRRRVGVEQDVPTSLVDLGENLVLGEVGQTDVPRSADVVEEEVAGLPSCKK